MGNTSSERAGLERHGHKASRGDSSGGAISTKEGDRPKILMDSPEDADLFHPEEMKVWLVCSCLVTLGLGDAVSHCGILGAFLNSVIEHARKRRDCSSRHECNVVVSSNN